MACLHYKLRARHRAFRDACVDVRGESLKERCAGSLKPL